MTFRAKWGPPSASPAWPSHVKVTLSQLHAFISFVLQSSIASSAPIPMLKMKSTPSTLETPYPMAMGLHRHHPSH